MSQYNKGKTNQKMWTWDLFRVRETFELNQLNPPIQNFYLFFQNSTGCKLVVITLDQPMSYIILQVPANFFFIVMTTSQKLGY